MGKVIDSVMRLVESFVDDQDRRRKTHLMVQRAKTEQRTLLWLDQNDADAYREILQKIASIESERADPQSTGQLQALLETRNYLEGKAKHNQRMNTDALRLERNNLKLQQKQIRLEEDRIKDEKDQIKRRSRLL
ncbi:MAG: hypothetical protein OXL37_17695 [Chloroflexota bacterium]|nr:hypothetical protein [Chloroflexota bacterium]MDE2958804.1 hypothetical protein [Chloroflexota bacterium]